MEISLIGKLILYADIILIGLICIIIWFWQLKVFGGRAMKNPDGTADDWHEQKLFYGIALADIFIAIPVTLLGIVLIFLEQRLGYYLTGLAAFWFVWSNAVYTITSLRFEKPKITPIWIIVFPFGAILGLVYIIWTLAYFNEIFLNPGI
jgi:hypothetical protein